MKKVALSFFLLSLSSVLNAGVFDSISGVFGGVKETVGGVYDKADGTIGGIIKDKDVGFVYDKVKDGSWDMGDIKSIYDTYGESLGIETILGAEALENLKSLGKGANILYKYCYSFSSPSVTNPFTVLNPCDLASLNPCDSVPDLSYLGLKKRSGEDLKKYCDSLGKGKTATGSPTGGVSTPSKPINENIKKINTNQILKDRYSKVNAKASGSSGSSGGGGGSKSTASVINSGGKNQKISESSIALANNKDNQEIQKIYYQNNYQGWKLLDDANSISDETLQVVDLSKFSNGYKTIDDYKDSIDDLIEIFMRNENQVNLTYLKNTAEMAFANINSQTANVSEQNQRKDSEANNLILEYEKQLELWKVSEMQKRIWLLTKEKEQVVSPTDEMLDSVNDVKTRISMVYFGEKNKNERADLLAKVEIEAFDKLEKARNIVKMAQIHSQTFDREAEYNRIILSLSSIK